MSSLQNYYAFLEVEHDASPEEIKKAYRRLVRIFHPDATHDPEANIRFHQIQEAYDVLSNAEKRDEYDAQHRRYEGTDEKLSTYKRNQEQADNHKPQPKQEKTKEAEAERRWRTLQSYHGATLDADDGPEATQGYARAPGTDHINPTSPDRPSILQKLKKNLTSSLNIKQPPPPTSRPRAPRQSAERPRVYQFSINAFESLSDSYREIALAGGEDNPRIIRVKIPAGVRDNAVLKVTCPETEDSPARTIEVRVRLQPHPLVERTGNDITLRIPITVEEALMGSEIEVPSLTNPVRIRIPSPWSADAVVKLAGQGLADERGGKGDLFYRTYIVLPEINNDIAKQAARLIGELYTGSVRRHVPLILDKSAK